MFWSIWFSKPNYLWATLVKSKLRTCVLHLLREMIRELACELQLARAELILFSRVFVTSLELISSQEWCLTYILIEISYYQHQLSSCLWNKAQWSSSLTLNFILPSETYLFLHTWNRVVNISNDITILSVHSIITNSSSTPVLQVDATYPNDYSRITTAWTVYMKNSWENL